MSGPLSALQPWELVQEVPLGAHSPDVPGSLTVTGHPATGVQRVDTSSLRWGGGSGSCSQWPEHLSSLPAVAVAKEVALS